WPSSVASSQSAACGPGEAAPPAAPAPPPTDAPDGVAEIRTPLRPTTNVWPQVVHCTDAPASPTLLSSSSYSVWQRSQRTSIYPPSAEPPRGPSERPSETR